MFNHLECCMFFMFFSLTATQTLKKNVFFPHKLRLVEPRGRGLLGGGSSFQLRQLENQRIKKSTRVTRCKFHGFSKVWTKMTQHVPSLTVSHPHKLWMCARSTVLPSSQQHFTSHLPNRSHSSSIHIYIHYRFLPKMSMGFLSFYWIFLDSPGSKWFDPVTSSKSQVRLPMQFLVSFLLQVIHLWSSLRSCMNLYLVKAWKCLTVSLNPCGPVFQQNLWVSEVFGRRLAWEKFLSGMWLATSCHVSGQKKRFRAIGSSTAYLSIHIKAIESSGAKAVVEASRFSGPFEPWPCPIWIDFHPCPIWKGHDTMAEFFIRSPGPFLPCPIWIDLKTTLQPFRPQRTVIRPEVPFVPCPTWKGHDAMAEAFKMPEGPFLPCPIWKDLDTMAEVSVRCPDPFVFFFA